MYGRFKRRDWHENVFRLPTGLRENAETAVRVGDLDLPESRGAPVVGRRKMYRCALVAKNERE